jgi:hypothetical protein
MIAFAIVAALCAVVIATQMIWPSRGDPGDQIASELLKLAAAVALSVDLLVWAIMLAARHIVWH